MRAVFEVIFVYLTCSYNFAEVRSFQLTKAAYKNALPSFPSKPYMRKKWKWLAVFSQGLGTITIVFYYLVIVPVFNTTWTKADWPVNPKEFWYGGGFNGGWYYSILMGSFCSLFLLFFNFIFVGARFFSFLKFHPGVRK
jgi:hypothetical protein